MRAPPLGCMGRSVSNEWTLTRCTGGVWAGGCQGVRNLYGVRRSGIARSGGRRIRPAQGVRGPALPRSRVSSDPWPALSPRAQKRTPGMRSRSSSWSACSRSCSRAWPTTATSGMPHELERRRHRRARRGGADQPGDVRPALDCGAAGLSILHALVMSQASTAAVERPARRRRGRHGSLVLDAAALGLHGRAGDGRDRRDGGLERVRERRLRRRRRRVAGRERRDAPAPDHDRRDRLVRPSQSRSRCSRSHSTTTATRASSAASPHGSGTASRGCCAGARRAAGTSGSSASAARPSACCGAAGSRSRAPRCSATSRSSSCCSWRCAPWACRAPT